MANPFLEPTKVYMYQLKATRPAIKVEGPTEAEAPLVAQHWAYLQELTAKGVLIIAGRTLNLDQDSFAMAVFRADSEDQGRAIMEADPAVRGGVFEARLFPFQMLLMGNWSPDAPTPGAG